MSDTLFGLPIVPSDDLPKVDSPTIGDYSAYMRVTVRCSCCGGTHVDLEVSRLDEPVIDEDETWTHASRCPFTDEQILMRIIKHQD